MADFGKLIWGPARDPISRRFSLYALDDSDDNVGGRMVLPRSGTITHVGWRLSTKVGSPPNYYVGMVTVTATTGLLTTTAYGGSTPATVDPTALAADSFYWAELAVPATAAAGDQVGMRVWPTGSPGPPDAGNYITVAHSHYNCERSEPNGMYATSLAGQTWANKLPTFGLKYSDGTVIGYPLLNIKFDLYDSADSPDEWGVKFTLPYAMRSTGIVVNMRIIDGNAGYLVKLYDGSDNLLGSFTVTDEDQFNDYGVAEIHWASAIQLQDGAIYRLTCVPTSSTLRISPSSGIWPDAATKSAYHEGATFQATSRTDAGAWTDYDDSTVFLALIIDDVTLPPGDGGGAYGFVG